MMLVIEYGADPAASWMRAAAGKADGVDKRICCMGPSTLARRAERGCRIGGWPPGPASSLRYGVDPPPPNRRKPA
jgi:hypothetical protein